jgi:hypothetical protein
MNFDYAFPENNEQDFLAVKKNLVFLYPKGRNFFAGKGVSACFGGGRDSFERGVPVIFGLEFSEKPDFIFHRNSGMNQVLAKIAKENNISVGFSFSGFKKAKNKAVVLGRMRQNMMLCRKYSVKTIVASFAFSPGELASGSELTSFRNLLQKKSAYKCKKRSCS